MSRSRFRQYNRTPTMSAKPQDLERPQHSVSNLPSRIISDCQDPQWRKLQSKYKEYIKLLKKKLSQLERKQNTSTKTSLTLREVEPLQTKMHKIMEQRIRTGFYHVLLHSVRRKGGVPNEERSQVHKDVCFKSGLELLLRMTRSRKQSTFKHLKEPEAEQQKSISNLYSVVQRKLLFSKVVGFSSIKSTFPLTKSLGRKELVYVKEILGFIDSNCSSNSLDNELYRLGKENCLLKARVQDSVSQLESCRKIAAQDLQRKEHELQKKADGINQLLEEITQKDRIIDHYELELETYRALKGKTKCSPDCQVEKKKLQSYYEKTLVDVKEKKDQLLEWETKYTDLLTEYNKSRKNTQEEVQHLKDQISTLEGSVLDYHYQKNLEANRVQNLNKRQMIMDSKELEHIHTQNQLIRLEQTINRLYQISKLNNEDKDQQLSALLGTTVRQIHFTTHVLPSPITDHHVISLVEKMLSEEYMKLEDYQGFNKHEQERLLVLESEITQMKEYVAKKEERRQQCQQEAEDILVVRPTQQRTPNNLLPRIMELESEAKEFEGTILDQKEKFLRARQTVVECLIALSIKNVSQQGLQRLEQLFDLFEPSDKDREAILLADNKSKQKLFRWI